MSAYPQVFEKPDVPYTALLAEATNLETKFNAAQNGGKPQSIELKLARASFENILRKEALYVDRISDGDELIIAQSGFPATKQPTPSNRPEFSVTLGETSGCIDLKHKASAEIKSWIWQYTTDPTAEDKWITASVTTQASYTVKALIPGVRYWFRSAGVTALGQQEWSDPVSQIAV